MQQQDNHLWTKTDNPNESVCLICGCTRMKERRHHGGRIYFDYYYERSGIVFGFKRPECIDWKLENEKIID
jgi:hypothetical protein